MTTHTAGNALALDANAHVAITYDRLSKDKKGDELGNARQDRKNREVAKNLGCTKIVRYSDKDVSASDPDAYRPEYQRMIDDIALGKLDGATLIGWAQDRIVRQGIETEQLLALLELHNVRLICHADGTDIRPAIDGFLIARIRGAVAAEEVRKLKARLREQQEQARAMGKRTGKIAFGWTADGTPDPIKADMIREAVRRVIGGEPLRKIAQDFNDRGLPRTSFTRKKISGEKLPAEEWQQVETEWTGRQIQQMIARPSYAGLYVHHGEVLDVTPQWTPLITLEEHLTILAIFNRRQQPRDTARRRYLLGGLIDCGRCGKGVHWGASNTAEGITYVIYRCGECGHRTYVDATDAFVTEAVVTRLENLKPADFADPTSSDRVTTISVELRKLDALEDDALDRAADFTRDDHIDAKTHAGLVKRWTAMREKLTAELEALIASSSASTAIKTMIGPGAREAFGAADLDAKRAAIMATVKVSSLPGSNRSTPIRERIELQFLV